MNCRGRRLTERIAAVCVIALSVGCAHSVSGTAEPARDSAGIIGIGRSVPKILPTSVQLTSALQSRFVDDGFPPSVGGSEVLMSGRVVSDRDGAGCVGVTDPVLNATYRDAPVRAVAIQGWHGVESDHWVDAGVVALASPRDAKALFARLVGQWQRCQGKSVTLRSVKSQAPEFRDDITGVRNADGLLTAVVTLLSFYDNIAFPSERAVGVAYNCIIDVNVTDFAFHRGDPATAQSAKAVFNVMAANAGASRR
jgi:PknH-like extracellular domain